MHITYVIVLVSDMGRSLAFYRDVIGLPVNFESPTWTELMTGEATLALHAEGGLRPSPERAVETSGSRCRPGFGVPDLDEFHARMVAHGVPCTQAPKKVFGVRVAQYLDPDGLPMSVSGATDDS